MRDTPTDPTGAPPWVVEQHAEDAAFLWTVRDTLVRAPHATLADVQRHDERVEAHLDGLRLAGDEGWAICADALDGGDAGATFVAAVLAFESGAEARLRPVLAAARAEPTLARGAASALGWLAAQPATRYAAWLLGAADPALRRLALAAFAAHRHDPGPALEQALADDDVPLRARALRAVGEVGRRGALAPVRAQLHADAPAVQQAAAWTAALLDGDGDALAVLARAVLAPGALPAPAAERTLQLVMRRAPRPTARALLDGLAREPATRRLAAVAAGLLGDPALVPWLLELMEEPASARAAADAFVAITGAELAVERLRAEAPSDVQQGPTDDPEDEDVAPDPDEHLDWPDVPRVRAWWAAHARGFTAGERHLLGHPIDDAWLAQVLRGRRQQHRAGAALELAIRHPGTALFEVRAPGFRQRQALGA